MITGIEEFDLDQESDGKLKITGHRKDEVLTQTKITNSAIDNSRVFCYIRFYGKEITKF